MDVVRKVKRAFTWALDPGLNVILPIWNVGWLVFNAKHWLSEDGWMGTLGFGFWLAICLWTFYAWGRNREHARARRVLTLAAATVHAQEELLKTTVVIPVLTIDPGEPLKEGQKLTMRIGPISMN